MYFASLYILFMILLGLQVPLKLVLLIGSLLAGDMSSAGTYSFQLMVISILFLVLSERVSNLIED